MVYASDLKRADETGKIIVRANKYFNENKIKVRYL